MFLPDYLYIEPQAGMVGAGIVMSTKPPFIWAKVYRFREAAEFNALKAQQQEYSFYQVPGYYIALTYGWYLGNNAKPTTEMISNALRGAGTYYLNQKINTNASPFKRNKIEG